MYVPVNHVRHCPSTDFLFMVVRCLSNMYCRIKKLVFGIEFALRSIVV